MVSLSYFVTISILVVNKYVYFSSSNNQSVEIGAGNVDAATVLVTPGVTSLTPSPTDSTTNNVATEFITTVRFTLWFILFSLIRLCVSIFKSI